MILLEGSRWSSAFRNFKYHFSNAWDATGPAILWSAAVTLVGAVVLGLGIVKEPIDTPLGVRGTLSVVIWDVTLLGVILSVPFLGLALLGFYVYFVHPPYRPYDLATVHSQKVHDTGGLAREAAIDAALRDEDEEGPPLLDFSE